MQEKWWHNAVVYQVYPKSLWIAMEMELVICQELLVS